MGQSTGHVHDHSDWHQAQQTDLVLGLVIDGLEDGTLG